MLRILKVAAMVYAASGQQVQAPQKTEAVSLASERGLGPSTGFLTDPIYSPTSITPYNPGSPTTFSPEKLAVLKKVETDGLALKDVDPSSLRFNLRRYRSESICSQFHSSPTRQRGSRTNSYQSL